MTKANQIQHYLKILNKNEYRITKPRRLILECLLDDSNYHSIEDIVEHIAKKTKTRPNISSIYNVLQTFIQLNIVDSFLNTSHDLKRYYTIKHEVHEHIYFINNQSRNKKNLNTLVIPDSINQQLKEYFDKIGITNLQYYIVVSGEAKEKIKPHKNDEHKE
ncbi:transcriptional repressor [Mycoplasma bradburyae]|uniref:Transcriptional repressor n=1 Tax=Mycoplasma bradburyae TaxID=2963128 RepID=A0AAW6HQ31_9MOLU|nr:transcriptional repressor [Mycoplasma bradburyae]MDC4183444.1 transcriptional repressor [Mycoplasma bradburyae]UTS70505.1 transcriptional repressor [Mycoplasma bradburyae]